MARMIGYVNGCPGAPSLSVEFAYMADALGTNDPLMVCVAGAATGRGLEVTGELAEAGTKIGATLEDTVPARDRVSICDNVTEKDLLTSIVAEMLPETELEGVVVALAVPEALEESDIDDE